METFIDKFNDWVYQEISKYPFVVKSLTIDPAVYDRVKAEYQAHYSNITPGIWRYQHYCWYGIVDIIRGTTKTNGTAPPLNE